MQPTIRDVRVTSSHSVISPRELHAEIPVSERGAETIARTRAEVASVIHDRQSRQLIIVVGPCSIHDVTAAREYAGFIEEQRQRYQGALVILMRVYFEKPRTTTGWKGLLNDPHLNGSYDMETGLRLGRRLLSDLADRGIPTASEILDPISPQYLAELMSWAAIGARTIESQTHREMASGLSMPIGLKNGTEGTLQTALNGLRSAAEPHRFLGIDHDGRSAIITTTGNRDAHLVLRGGLTGPNYQEESVRAASRALEALGLCPRVMIDCSHDNSRKDYRQQPTVCADLAKQVRNGSPILGAMIESNLVAGQQVFPGDARIPLRYGQSITDGCVDLESTAGMLEELAEAAAGRPVEE
jgi:3-deoxy-7-phosphoheptulonate synthase